MADEGTLMPEHILWSLGFHCSRGSFQCYTINNVILLKVKLAIEALLCKFDFSANSMCL